MVQRLIYFHFTCNSGSVNISIKISHQCSRYYKYFSSIQSRWRHEQNCQIKPIVGTNFTPNESPQLVVEHLPMQSPKDAKTKPKNLKIQALLGEIVNDGISMVQYSNDDEREAPLLKNEKIQETPAVGRSSRWLQETVVEVDKPKL